MIDFLKKLAFVSVIGLFWSCDTSVSKNGNLIDFVPNRTAVVFKISEAPFPQAGFTKFRSDFKKNALLGTIDANSIYADLSANAELLKHLRPTSASLLCLQPATDSIPAGYAFISRATSNVLAIDSLSNKTVETLTIGKKTLQRITINSQIAFTAIKDSIFIASSSQQQLLDVLDGKTEKTADFLKIYNIKNSGDFSLILKGRKLQGIDSTGISFASWTGLDVSVLPDGIMATGVTLARDSISELLTVFRDQVPRQNEIASVIPNNALGAIAFTFNDSELFQKRLKLYRNDKAALSTTGIFGSVNEVTEITLARDKAVALKSIDPALTLESLAPFITETTTFHEVTIHSFGKSELFVETFFPLIRNSRPDHCFQLDNFFVFTESLETAEQLITAFKNNNCLNNASYFDAYKSQLSTSSSLIFYRMQGHIPLGLSGFFGANSKLVSDEKYPLAVLQFSYDRDFAHVNFLCKEVASKKQISGMVSEVFNLKLPNTVLGNPHFFTNHNSNEKDVVVQDITNTLYLISSSGKINWQQKLDGPILGEVTEVDVLRNGKKQMAFATKHTFYIIDRNGKAVAPFPIKFKDPITQPLSVFDYDSNRKYRFVITQGKEVFMYDARGALVKGFTFKKTNSNIVLPPQHIRISNKDFIVIAEENGKLNLLSRTGKSRISVSKKFNFSEIAVEKEGSDFVVITSDNKKESIDTNGKVSSQNLNVSSNYWFEIKGNTKVTLDDNLLRINGKLTELPFGVYTKPQLFFANKTVYTSITETQEKKVFVFDTSGSLVPGFPVFGSSAAALEDTSNNGKLQLTVKGDDKEIILYRLK
jgi:hypothetical protein